MYLWIVKIYYEKKVNGTQNNQNNALNPNQKRYPL